jgi:hypothetical protein
MEMMRDKYTIIVKTMVAAREQSVSIVQKQSAVFN